VVTILLASGWFDLADVARFVGHSDVAATRGDVQHEGDRPTIESREILDAARARGASRVRVFGSVARGEATEARRNRPRS
jgi:hypothetical protein